MFASRIYIQDENVCYFLSHACFIVQAGMTSIQHACMCICIYAYECMHACMFVCAYVCVYVCTSYLYSYECMHVVTCIYVGYVGGSNSFFIFAFSRHTQTCGSLRSFQLYRAQKHRVTRAGYAWGFLVQRSFREDLEKCSGCWSVLFFDTPLSRRRSRSLFFFPLSPSSSRRWYKRATACTTSFSPFCLRCCYASSRL